MERDGRAERLSELLAAALDCAPDERAAFLAQSCGGDDGLRTEIESLLSCDPADFLARPAYVGNLEKCPDPAEGELKAGDVLGDCRIVSLLGVGGMGEVYLADDTTLGRQVAVKLIQRGLDGGSRLGRFRHERHVLAGLNHPHIARLYGGTVTPEGRAYLVMEYVEGERFDTACRRRQLSVADRLALFRKVCAAVSYAHQHLVVHRDLKPANIRVTPEGEPKLLDFGIAKLLDPESTRPGGEATLTYQSAMTPEYASPEQLRGEPITTASDVYSLGVILYELLCGERPYRLNTRRPDEAIRAVCEQEPTRPSVVAGRTSATLPPHGDLTPEKLRRQLAGDLDNIVAKAMRKEPARRYASVAQLSEDLRRHDEGLPVTARQDTFVYRAGKFARRNKTLVTAAALVASALTAGLAATIWQARRANERFEDVRQLARAILFEVEPQMAHVPGNTQARATLVRRASEYLDRLAEAAGGDRELRREVAAAYEKVGDVQGRPNTPDLGDLKGALASYRKAQEIRRSLVTADPRNAQARHELANNQEQTGLILWWSNETAGALENYRAALDLRRALLAGDKNSTVFRRGFASLQVKLGDVSAWNEQDAEALTSYGQALPIFQALAAEQPDNATAQVELARCLSQVGVVQKQEGNYAAAADAFTQAQGIVDNVLRRDSNDYEAQMESWFNGYSECEMFNEQKAVDRALELCPRMLAAAEALVRNDPENKAVQHDQAVSCNTNGEVLAQAHRWQEAVEQFSKALAIDTRLAAQTPENGEYVHSCGLARMLAGDARLHLGQLDAAETDEEAAQTLLEKAAGQDASNTMPQRELVTVFMTRGAICEERRQPLEARRWFQEALKTLEAATAKDSRMKSDPENFAILRKKLAGSAPQESTMQ